MTLEEAIQAAEARARERCRGCQVDAHNREWAGRSNLVYQTVPHTCHRDLKAVKDVALAALGHARDKVTAQWTDVHTLRCIDETLAEIERLFGEGQRRRNGMSIRGLGPSFMAIPVSRERRKDGKDSLWGARPSGCPKEEFDTCGECNVYPCLVPWLGPVAAPKENTIDADDC